jgi:hypothetical protein
LGCTEYKTARHVSVTVLTPDHGSQRMAVCSVVDVTEQIEGNNCYANSNFVQIANVRHEMLIQR